MRNRVVSLLRFQYSNYFYLVLLCGVVLAFLFMNVSGITNFFGDLASTISIPGSFLFFIFFLLPGYLVARQLILKSFFDKKYLLLLSVVLSSLIAFFVMWIYFFNHMAGRVVSVVIIVASAVFVVIRFNKLKDELLDEDFITPLTLMFFVGCMYLGILYLYFSYDYVATSNVRFVPYLPGDNVLPAIFLERLYHGESLLDFVPGWLASDRPPLFAAMLLLIRPFATFIEEPMYYQFLGTFIQCLWIPAMYSLCKFFSFDRKIRAFILGSSVFSGFFLVNSTYLWPKLATTLFFALLFLLVFELSKSTSVSKMSAVISVIIGVCAILGFLFHGGIAFSFIALVLALLIAERRVVFLKHAVFAIIPFVIIYLPWVLYQQLYDPPGNLLNKWHFAGMIEINDYSFWEAVYQSYVNRPIYDIFNKTISNILYLFAAFPDGYTGLEIMRIVSFSKTFGTALILNIFLITLAFYFLKTYCFEQKPLGYRNKIMLYFTFFSFTVWPLMMYSYSVTNINLGSYANIILVYILIAFGAKHVNQSFRNLIYVLNIIVFVVLWVFDSYATVFTIFSDMSRRMLLVMIVSAVLFFAYLHKPISRV